MSADPAPCMTDLTSAKSRLMRPGVVMRSVMPWTPARSTWSAVANASRKLMPRSLISSKAVVGHDDERVDLALERGDADVGLRGAALALEPEGARDDTDGERADRLGDARDDGCATGAGAAALARRDEDHVGSSECFLDLFGVIFGARRPTSGSAPAPSPRVSSRPTSSLTSASLMSSAWASVLMAMNSTPRKPSSIMRLTALTPPPPMPTTLMTAR
jgi:hypothetical protein